MPNAAESQRRSFANPLVSIVQATCGAAVASALERGGLFGMRFTMQARFYPEVFKTGIEVIGPRDEEQSHIHETTVREFKDPSLPM